MASLLSDMIHYLQHGTKLHISVLFIESPGNEFCELPREQCFHESPMCYAFKNYNKASFMRCYRCRNLAIKKVLRTKAPFADLCINGIYEYTHPVMVGERVACVIFIGNILECERGLPKLHRHMQGRDFPLDTMEPNFPFEDCAAIGKLLESYIRFLLDSPSQTQTENTLIKNVKSYLDGNLEFDVTIADVAEIFHYNERYLGRLFKKETGQCVHEYINAQRIEAAKELLRTTDRAVLDISGRIGFNNVTYFNMVFKNAVGITPTQYRKQYQ